MIQILLITAGLTWSWELAHWAETWPNVRVSSVTRELRIQLDSYSTYIFTAPDSTWATISGLILTEGIIERVDPRWSRFSYLLQSVSASLRLWIMLCVWFAGQFKYCWHISATCATGISCLFADLNTPTFFLLINDLNHSVKVSLQVLFYYQKKCCWMTEIVTIKRGWIIIIVIDFNSTIWTCLIL